MKKSNLIIIGLATMIFSSCTKNSDLYDPSTKEMQVNYEAVQPFETMTVSVPQGKIAYVISTAGDTIATTNVDGAQIEIPRLQKTLATSKSSRADNDYGFSIEYGINTGETIVYNNKNFCTVAFEDSKEGDYDYNDVVLHLVITKNGSNVNIYTQPIAMGGIKTLKFGLDLYCTKNGTTTNQSFTFTDDIRKDTKFFGSKDTESSFVNTYSDSKKYYRYPLTYSDMSTTITNWLNNNGFSASSDQLGFIWWIQDGTGTKYYSMPTSKINDSNTVWTDSKGYPYGIVFSGLYNDTPYRNDKNDKCGFDWFIYPLESTPIQTTYPNFDGWLKGTATVDWLSPVENTYVNVAGPTESISGSKATNPYSLYLYEYKKNANEGDYNAMDTILHSGYIYQ